MEYQDVFPVPQSGQASNILKKMYSKSYSLKSRNKKESKEFLMERLEQLKLDGKFNSAEGRMISKLLENI
ncbi:MAG: hypothetical protein ACOVP4_03830 [Bacteriovoracaceae bacterium]